MIRRQTIETKINHERWLVSYADFITLLFAFFVVMYSISQVNESKYKILADTLEKVFPENINTNTKELLSEGTSNQSQRSEENLAELDVVQEEILKSLSGMIDSGDVSLSGNEQWIEIALNANILFPSGKAQPSEQAKSIFAEVAEILAPHSNAIAVEGHTDTIPIKNQRFNNNWELSAARSVAIVSLLAYQGVSPERMSAVGHGEFHPIADNGSAEGREKNRRVVLKVAKEAVKLPSESINNIDLTNYPNETSQTATPDENVIQDDFVQRTETAETRVSEGDDSYSGKIQPVKLKSGGLLFSSDPQLPRNNSPIDPEP